MYKSFLQLFPDSLIFLQNDRDNFLSSEFYEQSKFSQETGEQKQKEGYAPMYSVNSFHTEPDVIKQSLEQYKQNRKAVKKLPTSPRFKENLKTIQACFVDLDLRKEGVAIDIERKKKEVFALLEKCPVPPTCTVITKNGLQALWKIEDDYCNSPDTKYVKLYSEVELGIIAWSKTIGGYGDQVKDVARILRLPGFYHLKNPKEPFYVEWWKMSMQSYSLDELYDFFATYIPPKKEVTTPLEFTPIIFSDKKSFNLSEEFNNHVNIRDAVIRSFQAVGATFTVDGDNHRWWINNVITGNFFSKEGKNIACTTSGKEPYSGPPFAVVIQIFKRYGKEARDAIKFINETWGSQLNLNDWKSRELVLTPIENKSSDDLSDEFQKPTKIFTWGTDRLNKEITPIQTHHFIILAGNSGAGKTAFAFDVAFKNARENKRVFYLSLEMSRDEIITRAARTHAGITKIEWRDKSTIPDYKMAAAKRKINEMSQEKNLILQGFRQGIMPTVENIFLMIEQINPDLTFVDNFDLIAKDKSVSEYTEQTRIADEFMHKCHDLLRPVIVIHHKNPKNKISGLGGVRGSGKITDNCNIALACSRKWKADATPKENARFTVAHEKDRDFGGLNLAEVYFKGGTFVDEYGLLERPDFWDK